MIISRSTPVQQSFSNLSGRKQIRPANFAETQKSASKTLSQVVGSNFYRGMAFLLILMGGCKDAGSEKEEKSPPLDIQAQASFVPSINLSHSKKDAEINRQLAYLEKHLFDEHLLSTVDILGDLVDASNGKGLTAQMLLSKRLTPEIFPVLWNKVFLDGPDKVIVAEHTELGNFSQSNDFGRGLRLILRKKVGDLNTSTILFLDYNEKTKKLEFPQDFFFNDKRRIIPDAMRTLIEYDVKPTPQQLKEHKTIHSNDYLSAGLFGTTISAEIDTKTPEVVDFHILPTRDKNNYYFAGKDGKTINSVSSLACIGCHGDRREGFGSTDTSYEEIQRDLHLPSYQEAAIKHFLQTTAKTKHFDSKEEMTEVLGDLERKLHAPKNNLSALLPTGFFEAMKRKQTTIIHPSLVLERYNALGSTTLTKAR